MVASGIPVPNGNHARDLADFSLDMRNCMETYSQDNGLSIQIRIGIHSGPAVAGVIGKKKFIYDVWGDTVNTAARMESHGKPGEIHISNLTKNSWARLCLWRLRQFKWKEKERCILGCSKCK